MGVYSTAEGNSWRPRETSSSSKTRFVSSEEPISTVGVLGNTACPATIGPPKPAVPKGPGVEAPIETPPPLDAAPGSARTRFGAVPLTGGADLSTPRAGRLPAIAEAFKWQPERGETSREERERRMSRRRASKESSKEAVLGASRDSEADVSSSSSVLFSFFLAFDGVEPVGDFDARRFTIAAHINAETVDTFSRWK